MFAQFTWHSIICIGCKKRHLQHCLSFFMCADFTILRLYGCVFMWLCLYANLCLYLSIFLRLHV